MTSLTFYGWNKTHQDEWNARDLTGLVPARVVVDYGRKYKVATPSIYSAQLAGTLTHSLKPTDMPKVGDWVGVRLNETAANIQAVLPRSSELVRGQAGRLLDKQVVAANVDTAFIVQPLDHDFSPERLERYIFQLQSQHITPILILNKADIARDIASKQARIADLGVDTITMSILHDEDISHLQRFITKGQTVVVLGSSGAGKSTLINRLLGEERQVTAAVRERDSKGRHTTVHRELFLLPSGGCIIDTPGIRELQLWGNEADLAAAFPDIVTIIQRCKYKNCTHGTEDGCAVKAAVRDGTLDTKRLKSYVNFQQELRQLQTRRGFIAERRSEQARSSAARRRRRSLQRDTTDADEDEVYDTL